MDDKLMSPESAKQAEGQNRPNNDPANGAEGNGGDQGGLDILIDIVETVAGLIFGGISFELSDAGFHIWSYFFGFLAIECAVGVICHRAGKTKFKRFVWQIFLVFTVLNIGFFGFLTWHLSKTPEIAPVAQPPRDSPTIDTKQQIRSLLDEISPNILQMADAGNNKIHVMLGKVHEAKLMAIAGNPEFGKYLEVQSTGEIFFDSPGMHYIAFVDDQDGSLQKAGYIFFPKDALRRSEATPLEPDYIPGTKFTHGQLENLFPYGYTIFSPGENMRWKYEVFNTKLAKWQLDWENVTIEPNFGSETVAWKIPSISVDFPNGTHFQDNVMALTTVYKSGTINFCRGVVSQDNPGLFVGTLSDNQRTPVFVIGMRIPSVKDIMDGVSVDMHQ